MPLTIEQTNIDGLVTYDAFPLEDERGSFSRLFCVKELSNVIGDRKIVQINQSVTKNVGTMRGMHYQNSPYAEMKIVRCLSGCVFDVAVDLRKESPTFLKWFGVELSADNKKAIIIPEGFAHGFQAIESNSVLLYLHTSFYHPKAEAGFHYADKSVNIAWPLTPCCISERDKTLGRL